MSFPMYRPCRLAVTETVHGGSRLSTLPKVLGCPYKTPIDVMYNNNRYRYDKNAIIVQIVSSLVGISDCLLLELVLFIAG